MTRYVVREVTGYLEPEVAPRHAEPGVTAHVLDTVVNFRIVGTFRSEDHAGRGRKPGSRLAVKRARRMATKYADRLNRAAS